MTKGEKMALWAAAQVGCAYIFATAGEACTPTKRRAQVRSKPLYADNIRKYCPVLSGKKNFCDGCDWQGKKAYDCRGLIYQAAKAAGLTISSIGSTSQWKGDYWQEKGPIDGMQPDKPCVLFHQDDDDPDVMSHVGMYLGKGQVADARGHRRGVVQEDIVEYPWTHYGILRGADEPYEGPDEARQTLRKGSRGEDVLYAQTILAAAGHGVGSKGPDGVFGQATQAAVRAFQADHDLTPDGIIGPKTWAVLETAGEPQGSYTVRITGLIAGDATALLEAWGDQATIETEGRLKAEKGGSIDA